MGWKGPGPMGPWLGGALRQWLAQNRVTGLIGTLMASNRILRASPGRESQAKVDSGPGLVPGVGKGTEMSGYLGRVGRNFESFSGFFPEWSGMAWEGLGSIIWGSGGAKNQKNAWGRARLFLRLQPGQNLLSSTALQAAAFAGCSQLLVNGAPGPWAAASATIAIIVIIGPHKGIIGPEFSHINGPGAI